MTAQSIDTAEHAQWYCLSGFGGAADNYVIGYFGEAVRLWQAANRYNRQTGCPVYCTIAAVPDDSAGVVDALRAGAGHAPTIAEAISVIDLLS